MGSQILSDDVNDEHTQALAVEFMAPIIEFMSNRDPIFVWVFYSPEAHGRQTCRDCCVPLMRDEVVFYEYEYAIKDVERVSVWLCLECSMHWAARSGVEIGEFPFSDEYNPGEEES